MDNSQEVFDLIEKYLKGDISDAERSIFEKKISSDSELANKVAAHRIANELVMDYSLLKMRDEIQTWHKENDSKAGTSGIWKGGIIVALIIIGSIIIQMSTNEEPAQDLYPTQPTIIRKEKFVVPESDDSLTFYQQPHTNFTVKTIQDHSLQSLHVVDSNAFKSFALNEIQPVQRKSIAISVPDLQSPQHEIPLIGVKNCHKTLPLNSILFEGSCDREINGFIEFTNMVLDGEIPVAYSIDSGKSYQNFRDFRFLENGVYYPILEVSGGCIFIYPNPILLTSGSDCENKETYVINSTLNQYWEPKLNLENAKIQIRNSNGVLVYSGSLDVQFKWYGLSQSGTQLPMGDYFFIVESLGKSFKSGNITILR